MFKSTDFRNELLLQHPIVFDGQRYLFLSLLFSESSTFLICTSQAGAQRPSPQSNRDFLREELVLRKGNLPAEKLTIDGVEIRFHSTVAYPAGHPAVADLASRYHALLPRFSPNLCWQISIGDSVFPPTPCLLFKDAVLTLKKQTEEIYIGKSFCLRENQAYPYQLPGETAPYEFHIHNIVRRGGPTALIYTAGAEHHLNFYDQAYLDEPWTSQNKDSYALFLPEALRQDRRVCVCQAPQVSAAQGQLYELFSITRPGREKPYPLI